MSLKYNLPYTVCPFNEMCLEQYVPEMKCALHSMSLKYNVPYTVCPLNAMYRILNPKPKTLSLTRYIP